MQGNIHSAVTLPSFSNNSSFLQCGSWRYVHRAR